MVLRTNLLTNKNYSYSKNYLGSIKNNTPGYYPLGYFMVSKMRRDFGGEILDKTLTRIAKFPVRPFNFSSSFKKYSGYNTRQLYLKTMVEMDSLWQQQAKLTKNVKYVALNPQTPRNPTNYLFPFLMDDGSIICLKNSKGITPSITLLSQKGKQKTLVRIAYQTEPNIHYANGLLVWDEFRSDERFHQRSFNVINTYNLKTKIYKQLTYKSRLFSPSLSADAKTIIAVKVSTLNKFELVELEATTGKQLQTYPNPENLVLQFPQFDVEGERIVVTALNQKGKTLLVYNRNKKTFEQLLDFSRQLINRPFFYKNQIIYKAHYNGIDNLYSLNLKNKKISQLTNAQFGAFNANINGHKFLFNDYQYNGYNIVKLNIDSIFAKADSSYNNNFVEYFKPLIAQESSGDVLKKIPNKIYETKPYSELGHLFYFHSISPITNNDNFFDTGVLGLNILSNNKLATFAFTAGYQYQQNLQRSQYHFSLSYAKYYPILSFTYQNRPQMAQAKAIQNKQIIFLPFFWRENYSKLNVKLPYKTNWLNQNLTMYFNASTSFTQRYNTTIKINNFPVRIKFPLQYQYAFSLNQAQSPRDLAPRFGQNIIFGYSHLPFNTQKGQIAFVRSQFYFPGLFLNHSLQASYNMQNANGVYNYDIDIPRASGTANIDAIGNIKNSLLLDYRFPIAYPDFELGPLTYIKRFKGGFFFDFENLGTGKGLRTFGVELRTDMNLLRYYLPNFELGGKLIFPVNNRSKSPIFEFGFNYNL